MQDCQVLHLLRTNVRYTIFATSAATAAESPRWSRLSIFRACAFAHSTTASNAFDSKETCRSPGATTMVSAGITSCDSPLSLETATRWE